MSSAGGCGVGVLRLALAAALACGVSACGFTTHMAVAHRALEWFYPIKNYTALLRANRGAMEVCVRVRVRVAPPPERTCAR